MRLTIHLNSYSNTEVKDLDQNDRVLVIGKDSVDPNIQENSVEWFFEALNFSTILKSEMETERGLVYDKIKLVNLDIENDDFRIPREKIYPDCIFSPTTTLFIQHPEEPEKVCKKTTVRLANIYKFATDSMTYDKVASMMYKNYKKFAKKYTIYALVEESDLLTRKRDMSMMEYFQFKTFNNLNIKSYGI